VAVKSRGFWISWLQVVLGLLVVYSLVLVLAGSVAGDLFAALGFGPSDAVDSDEVREYLKLPFMVLGAVMAGWAATMIQVVRGPLREDSVWALRVLASSLAVWFVLDTGMSLVLGYPTHALFNVPFGIALGAPLVALRESPSPPVGTNSAQEKSATN